MSISYADSPKSNPLSLLLSLLVHATCVALLWYAGRFQMQSLEAHTRQKSITVLTPSVGVRVKPLARPRLHVQTPVFRPPEPARHPVPVRIETPIELPQVQMSVELPARSAPMQPVPPPPTPAPPSPPPVRTNVFSAHTNSAPPAVLNKVQVGSFSAPSVGPTGQASTQVVSKSGFGDAAGTPKIARRQQTTSSVTGFEGTVAGAPRPNQPRQFAKAHDSVFETVASAPAVASGARHDGGLNRRVEILQKPRPEYTEEGRKKQIEGDVLLEVLFLANGESRVKRLIRGLGYGLDENAAKAMQAIQFRPALSNGLAIDSVATVRVSFQLAY